MVSGGTGRESGQGGAIGGGQLVSRRQRVDDGHAGRVGKGADRPGILKAQRRVVGMVRIRIRASRTAPAGADAAALLQPLVTRHRCQGYSAETACTVPLIFLHSVVAIVLLVAVLGAAASVSGATWSALVPRVVGEDHIAGAVSAQQSLSALAMMGAPAVGAVLAGAFGSGLPLAIDAAVLDSTSGTGDAVTTCRYPAEPFGEVEVPICAP